MQKDIIRAQGQKSIRAQGQKYTSTLCTCALMTCALVLAGCAEQQQNGTVKPICVENIDKLQAMEMAEDILAKMHFTIEKADADPATLGINTRRWRGFIRTRPLAGAQFFEFWRSDNVGASNWLESNLHSIRRVVELNMSEQDKELCINCNVQIYRLSLPEHHVSSSARAYEMFSESDPALQNLKLLPEQKAGMAWIDLGKDRQLAAEILKRISSMLDTRYSLLDIENQEFHPSQ
ncbi:MAG: hypothetical protein WAV28_16755 [Sedimentisphaerales bacterium]